jgi:hypothetical protein
MKPVRLLIFLFISIFGSVVFAKADTVELVRLEDFGADGSVQFKPVDENSPLGSSTVSFKCIEDAWSGKTHWRYHEIFVPDPKGKAYTRPELPAGNNIETGWSYQFKNFNECDKATRMTFKADHQCRVRIVVDTEKKTARFKDSNCVPVEAGAGDETAAPTKTAPSHSPTRKKSTR